jgi:hypothetical protein
MVSGSGKNTFSRQLGDGGERPARSIVAASGRVCYDSRQMNEDPSASVKRVTRDVEPATVRDLLEDPPRAAVAFVEAEEVDVLPARARFDDGVSIFAVRADVAPDLGGREVVLVRDDGPYWFELRGISVRGVAKRAAAPDDESGRHLVWYAIEPRRVLAWDYGALRAS